MIGNLNLKTVYIPNTIKTIQSYSFSLSDSLETVIMEGVIRIDMLAFYSCGSLKTIITGGSLTTIGKDAFDECDSLETVIINSKTIANELIYWSSCEGLISDVNVVYIESGLTVTNSTYLLNNFTKQETSDKAGYDMYISNAFES